MSKGFVFGFAFGLALLGIVGAGASRQGRRDQGQRDIEKYQAEIADATPVQVGILTRKQRFHSRLYNGYSKSLPGESISEWIASYRGKRTVLERNVYGRMWFPSDRPDVPEDYFARFAQGSDAIVRGRAIQKTSQITEDDSFLFTDYDVVVSEVFKDNAAAPIDAGKTITVTYVGGKIVVDNVIIKAGGNAVALLPVNGQDVLLFLRFVSVTDGYQLANNGAFELNGVSARPVGGYFNFDSAFFENENSFLKSIKQVSSNGFQWYR